MRPIRVRKPLPSLPWLVTCEACQGGGFFAMFGPPLRTAQRHDLAVAWAHQHARKHAEAMCPVCEHVGPIQDDSKHVEVRR